MTSASGAGAGAPRLSVPRHSRSAGARAPGQLAKRPAFRVFLVEDRTSTRGLLRDLFTAIGGFHIAGAAGTEAEALLWLQEHPHGWDIAVIDLVLEQGTGMGVIPRAKAGAAAGRVVVLSGYASPGVRSHCVRLGADIVFDKSEASEFTRYCVELAEREHPGL